MKRYEQFSHTADIGVRVFGRTLEELIENAAFAMFDIIADLDGLKGDIIRDFELTAPNYEELLISWLDELLYNFYTKGIIFYKYKSLTNLNHRNPRSLHHKQLRKNPGYFLWKKKEF